MDLTKLLSVYWAFASRWRDFTIIVYIAFLAMLIWNRRHPPTGAGANNVLKGSFFTLTIWLGVTDVLFMIISVARRGLVLVAYVESLRFVFTYDWVWMRAQQVLQDWTNLAGLLLTLAIAVNRFTAVAIPIGHKTFWEKHLRNVLNGITAMTLIGGMFGFGRQLIVVWPGRYDDKFVSEGVFVHGMTTQPWHNYFIAVYTMYSIVASIGGSVLYVLVFIELIRKKSPQAASNNNDSNNSAAELKLAVRLTIIGVVMLIPCFNLIIYWIQQLFFGARFRVYFSLAYITNTTIQYTANPYLITILSKDVQHGWKRMFAKIRIKHTTVAPTGTVAATGAAQN